MYSIFNLHLIFFSESLLSPFHACLSRILLRFVSYLLPITHTSSTQPSVASFLVEVTNKSRLLVIEPFSYFISEEEVSGEGEDDDEEEDDGEQSDEEEVEEGEFLINN